MGTLPIEKVIKDSSTYARSVNLDDPKHAHKGVDIIASPTEVFAPEKGEILSIDLNNDSEAGKWIAAYFPGMDKTLRYLHLSQIKVKSKDQVVEGQILGKSGNTNGSKAGGTYHLHLEVWNGKKTAYDYTQNADIVEPTTIFTGLTPRAGSKKIIQPTVIDRKDKIVTHKEGSILDLLDGGKKKAVTQILDNDEDRSLIDQLKNTQTHTHEEVTSYDTIASNNWMNIRASKAQVWLGQTDSKDGFVIFEKPEYSVRAFYKIMNSYINRGVDTVEKIANEWAPKSDFPNKPEDYVSEFFSYMNTLGVKIPENQKVMYTWYPFLAKVFMNKESSISKDITYFKKIYQLYM